MSEKGGNYVTSGWFRDWMKVVVVVAGREGRASLPLEDHHDIPGRGEEVEPTLTRFALNS